MTTCPRIDLSGGKPVTLDQLTEGVQVAVQKVHPARVLLLDYPKEGLLNGCGFLPMDIGEGSTGTFVIHRDNLQTVMALTVENGASVEVVRKNNSSQAGHAIYYDHDAGNCHVIRIN